MRVASVDYGGASDGGQPTSGAGDKVNGCGGTEDAPTKDEGIAGGGASGVA